MPITIRTITKFQATVGKGSFVHNRSLRSSGLFLINHNVLYTMYKDKLIIKTRPLIQCTVPAGNYLYVGRIND